MEITDSTISGLATLSGSFVSSNGFQHDASLDRTFYVDEGITASASIEGTMHTGTLTEDGTISAAVTILGAGIPGRVFQGLIDAACSLEGRFYDLYKKTHWVGWSKIGDVRIIVDEGNEAGYRPLPGRETGKVHKVIPYQTKFPIVYSDHCIMFMEPVTSPFSTFGFKLLLHKGILGQGAACGGENKHFFIDKNKELYGIKGAPPQIERLGYKEFIDQISPNNELIVMNYDHLNDRVYISSKVGGLILTDQGMGEGFADLTFADGTYFASPSEISDPAQEVVTDILDFRYRGMKTVYYVAVGTDLGSALQVAIDYRYDKSDDFLTSEWKLCNKEGIAFPVVAGVDMRVRIKTSVYEDFEIDYITVGVKFADKRFDRGGYTAGLHS